MADNQAFMVSINAFVSQAKARQEEVMRVVGIKILARLVQMSPVGNPELWAVNQTATAYNAAVAEHNSLLRQDPDNLTKAGRLRPGRRVNDSMDLKVPPGYTGGRFRGNWQVSFDQQASGETGRIDKAGHETIAAGSLVLEQFKVGTTAVYFCNNVPYAYRLEMGHSSQAPGGMVRITAAEFRRFFSEAVSEVKNDTGHHNGA
ncbi:hypothetical protein [Leclercia adecarboxylata]|uniref:HK97 gp10 family phage protein n=1 Tax=Leclercia adecarboxylata TaxID=83655 RepID=A0A4U9I0R0_9ENTR|nr:hypothetical protein [Leclercia adecarboxylata]KFC98521.1 hypothetical protein GLAD_00539 [Leclercia adecarboxylata ATCC 23216 = NBRC 102595]MEC3904968.1 hypothetical protein [Leclercia adecarboxylata]MEC3938720.1 hypothetical protein [Leclercia adecarboxylata]PHH04783.1 hypothetical protein CRX53_12855 [Leclercia adecarboxylata]UBH68610.1 hypothetical protein LA332_04955 [Leclercia adecarboxylata]